jgi:hypothetical protein
MRLQVVVDNLLGNELNTKAHELGFSTSSYVRHLIKKALDKNQKNQIDLALDDIKNGRVETISLEDFKKEIEELY